MRGVWQQGSQVMQSLQNRAASSFQNQKSPTSSAFQGFFSSSCDWITTTYSPSSFFSISNEVLPSRSFTLLLQFTFSIIRNCRSGSFRNLCYMPGSAFCHFQALQALVKLSPPSQNYQGIRVPFKANCFSLEGQTKTGTTTWTASLIFFFKQSNILIITIHHQQFMQNNPFAYFQLNNQQDTHLYAGLTAEVYTKIRQPHHKEKFLFQIFNNLKNQISCAQFSQLQKTLKFLIETKRKSEQSTTQKAVLEKATKKLPEFKESGGRKVNTKDVQILLDEVEDYPDSYSEEEYEDQYQEFQK